MRHALLVAALALAACGDDLPEAPIEWVAVTAVPAVPARELDLLILVDDSASTLEYQGDLAAAMPTLVAALDALDGGRPNLHVGVASSDLGTTGSLDYAHPAPAFGSGAGSCSDGDDGVLQPGLATLTAGTYLIDDAGATNYGDAELATALGQLVMLGSNGCGFEQQLAGIRRALSTPLNGDDFLRPSANLAILLIGDEDDCSVRDAGLFSPDTAELGPFSSFRCVRQGIVCDESLDTVGAKSNCRSRADSRYIEDVQPFADFLLGLKAHPQQLAVAAIVGPATPMALELRSPPGGGTAYLAAQHSCPPSTSANVADPGVRVADWLTRFPNTPTTLMPICQHDLTPAVTALGQLITRSMQGDACIDTTTLLDTANEPGFQLACEVVDIADADPDRELPIAACDATTPTNCFAIITDAALCPHTPEHLRVERRRSQPGVIGTWSHLRCRAR